MGHRSWHSRLFLFLVGVAVFGVFEARTGERIERLDCDGDSYFNVSVREVTASTLVILHSKGLAQLELRSLSPEWQERFGYDASKDVSERRLQESMLNERIAQTRKPPKPKRSVTTGALLRKFGMAPEIYDEVDFRGRLAELELGTRNQGMRPSCSVFAVLGAMEYMLSDESGQAEKLSEEYLIWAVLKTLGQGRKLNSTQGGGDIGFTLPEVAQAIRAYGVPLREEMPYAVTSSLDRNRNPSPDIVEKARARSKIGFYHVPGREADRQIENMIHALNENVPVVVGVKWPHYKTLLHTALLSGQKPRENYAHAVTLIGYRNETGRLEDTTFIFRNSWGRRWGSGGYGFIRYEYLESNLVSAIFLEVDSD